MLHLIVKKISTHLIIGAFSLLAFGVIALTIQTQKAYQESNQRSEAVENTPTGKTIYIDNFPIKTGYISSKYGMRKDPFTGKRRMHKGIDIAARQGTSVYPIGKGKVIFSGRKAGYGITIEIQHSRTVVSRYSHLKKSLVKIDQQVKTTDVVAQVGNTGRSTGPHLHLEIAFNGETSNPRNFLSQEVASK